MFSSVTKKKINLGTPMSGYTIGTIYDENFASSLIVNKEKILSGCMVCNVSTKQLILLFLMICSTLAIIRKSSKAYFNLETC